MTATAFCFAKFAMNAFGGDSAGETPNIDFLSDSIKCALFTSAHAPEYADEFYDGAHGMTEVSPEGTTYVTGGKALTGKELECVDKVTTFKAADVSWESPSGITARYACIYDDTPASNKPFLWWIDLGADSSCSGTWFLGWDAAGIATITVA